MNMKALPALLLVCLIFAGGCATTSSPDSTELQAGNTLTVINVAPFDPDIDITDAVRNQCKLETRLPKATYDIVRKKDLYDEVNLADQGASVKNGSVLALRIADAKGYGGGPWSGPKYLLVEGTLSKDGKVIGSFTVSRAALWGGPFSGFAKKTCGLFAKSTKKIAKDIGEWMKSPTMHAKLGSEAERPARSKKAGRGNKEKEDE